MADLTNGQRQELAARLGTVRDILRASNAHLAALVHDYIWEPQPPGSPERYLLSEIIQRLQCGTVHSSTIPPPEMPPQEGPSQN